MQNGSLDQTAIPDPIAIRQLGAGYCARHGIVPLRPAGAVRPVLCEDAAGFAALAADPRHELGRVVPVPASADRIAEALIRFAGAPLARVVARAFLEPRQVPLVFAGSFFGFKAQNQRARPRSALLLL